MNNRAGANDLISSLVQIVHCSTEVRAVARADKQPGSSDVVGRSRQRLTDLSRQAL